MKKFVISQGDVCATILPDFGGMVAELKICEVNVLRMDYNQLGTANVLAGGIPVLFPFVSRCKNDEINFHGAVYTMPMHGFVKDMPFKVVDASKSTCTLSLDSNEMTRRLFPFDFSLVLIYEVSASCLKTTLRIENRGEEDMPFVAGYHPYFLTPDRSKTSFDCGLTEFWDYTRGDTEGNPLHGYRDGEIHLKDEHDTVFWNGNADAEIVSEEMGYRAKLLCNGMFNVITICTMLENASCIEPWQGRPGAATRQEECQWLVPGSAKEYTYTIHLEKL